MKDCRYCQSPLKEEDVICPFCGYDSKTDTISPSFRQSPETLKKMERVKDRKRIRESGGIDPRVKKFAYVGLAVVTFSVFYKYSFNVSGLVNQASSIFSNIKIDEIMKGKFDWKKLKTGSKTEMISLKSFQAPTKVIRPKGLTVEGILFDPNGKSFATINGNVLAEGDTIGNVKVNKINKDSVEVTADGVNKILEVSH